MKKLLAIVLALVVIMGMSLGVVTANEVEYDGLIADAIEGEGTLSTLSAALNATGLDEALRGDGPFTVFAPTDEAFDALEDGVVDKLLANPEILEKVLLYHVVAGQFLAADAIDLDGEDVETLLGQTVAISVNAEVMVNSATVTDPDLTCNNGVIHVIDEVLLPALDIIDTAIMAPDFYTLVSAIEAAGLEEALKGEGPFTCFAPTDDAFGKLPEGLLEELLDNTDDLSKVLLYHVVSGEVTSADVLNLDGEEVETLLGQMIIISLEGDGVFVNDAEVTDVDIECSNGIIHVLDSVLIPDLEEEVDEELPETGLSFPYALMGVLVIGAGMGLKKQRK